MYILDMGVGFVSEDSAGIKSWIWVLGLYQRTVLGINPGYGVEFVRMVGIRRRNWVFILDVENDSTGHQTCVIFNGNLIKEDTMHISFSIPN